MAPTRTVSTLIPAGLSNKAVLAALHNNELMIKTLAPNHISYEFESGDPNTQATYSVTDKKPVGQTTYKLALTNVKDGVDSFVDAKPPVGVMTIVAKWRIVDDKLQEDVDIEANMLIKKMAKSNVDKTRPTQHKWLLEQAAKA